MTTDPANTPREEPASAPAEKSCPECGRQLRAAAALCLDCGYTFPLGKQSPGSVFAPATDAAAGETSGDRRELLRLAAPVIVLAALLAVAAIFIFENRTRETWSTDLARVSGMPTWSDQEFERWYADQFAADAQREGFTSDVRAAGGICLVNIQTGSDPKGLLSRMSGKLIAKTLACTYANFRRLNRETSSAEVVIYFNGRRYLSGKCQ